METTTIALLVLIPLLVWRIYSRVKRMMGRQPSRLWRHWAGAVAFPLALLAAAWSVRSDVLALSCLGGGALAGVWLGLWNLKLTRYEQSGAAYFYTPNLYLGMLVTMLFVTRILYRVVELYLNSRAALAEPMHGLAHGPLTSLAFGVMAAYYAAYGCGLLRWRQR